MAFHPKFKLSDKTTKYLLDIERAHGFLLGADLSDEWIAKMQSRALLLEAHHTTHIEGTQLTLDQSEDILEGLSVDAKPDDKQELLNYRDAFEFVVQYRDGITEDLIRQMHQYLVKDVRGGEGDPGRFRVVQNYIVNSNTKDIIYRPPPPEDVPKLMQQLTVWANQKQNLHPVLISAILQFQLLHIHPFVDGNGRTSRLLSTYYLYKTGYDFKRLFSISEYYDRDKVAYYEMIQQVHEQDLDMTHWLEYFTEGLAIQMQEVVQRGEMVIKQSAILQHYSLSDSQKKALDYVVKNRNITLDAFALLCSDIDKRTLQPELSDLVQKGVFVASGPSDAKEYRLAN